MARNSRHWYTVGSDGRIETAHDLDLRGARKAKAYISPTSIIQEVRASPYQIVQWSRKQLVAACVECPKNGESLEDYYRKVDELSYRKSDEATKFGTRIHEVVEHYPARTVHSDLGEWHDRFQEWHQQHVDKDLAMELKVADNDIGVAGTMDRLVVLRTGEIAAIDCKTQGVKDRVYIGETWPKQLAFYANAVRKSRSLTTNPVCINIVIDSNAPVPFVTKRWTTEEINEAYKDFLCEIWLWSRTVNHWPCGTWNLADALNDSHICQ